MTSWKGWKVKIERQTKMVVDEWLAHAKRTLADAVSGVAAFLDARVEAGELSPSAAANCKTLVERQVNEALARAAAQVERHRSYL